MRALFFALTFILIGIAIGYFGRGSAETLIRVQHYKPLIEVRDQYFRKCELTDTIGEADKVTRQYQCERLQIQLVQRWHRFTMQPAHRKEVR